MDRRKITWADFFLYLILMTVSGVGANGIRIDWMRQIVGYIEPIPPSVDSICREHTSEYVEAGKNLSNSWAINMIDATAKFPSGILLGNVRAMGAFDQCLRVRHPADKHVGKYCQLRLQYSTHGENKDVLQRYIDVITSEYRLQRDNENITDIYMDLQAFSISEWAVCLPSTCSSKDIEIIMQAVFQRVSVDTGLAVFVFLNDDWCQTEWNAKPSTIVDIIITLVFVGVILSIISVTMFGYFSIPQNVKSDYKTIRNLSIIANWKELIDFKPPSSSTITCLHGIRVLSTCWIIMTHRITFMRERPYANRIEAMQTQQEYVYYPFWNSYHGVDTFMLISGLLSSYNICRALSKENFNFIKSTVNRYIRLTPAYLFVILFYISFFDRLGSGPNWNLTVTTHAEKCKKYWWHNLLYINNYTPLRYKCLYHSWYLSAEMQLFIIAPLLVYPLWKSKVVGLYLMTMAMIISIVLPMFTTFMYKFPAMATFFLRVSVLDWFQHDSYEATHNRMTVYFVGLILGYIFHQKKRYISSKAPIMAGWIVSLCVMSSCVYGPKDMTSVHHTYNLWETVFYVGFHRFAWALATAWVIYACHNGYGGVINSFLSCDAFRFFSRLTYCVYLVHFGFVSLTSGLERVPNQFYAFLFMRDYLGDLIPITAIAMLLYFFVEQPFSKMLRY